MTELELTAGGRGRLVETDGDAVKLDASRAFAPGSTLYATAGELGELRVKVRACRKQGAEFRVEGRFVNLSREQRERLLAG